MKERTGAREGDTRGVRELPLPSRVSFSLACFFLCPLLPSYAVATQAILAPHENHAGYGLFLFTQQNSDFGAFVLTEGNDLEQGA